MAALRVKSVAFNLKKANRKPFDFKRSKKRALIPKQMTQFRKLIANSVKNDRKRNRQMNFKVIGRKLS